MKTLLLDQNGLGRVVRALVRAQETGHVPPTAPDGKYTTRGTGLVLAAVPACGALRTLGRSIQRKERRGITVTTDATNRSRTSLPEPGDLNLFLREGVKQVKMSLGSEKEREGEFQLAQRRAARLKGSGGKDTVSLAPTGVLWSVLKCDRHKEIGLMTRQEVSLNIDPKAKS